MAERNNKPVKVILDVRRFYRAKDEDTEAISVGPGEAEVPAWVAEAWGLKAEAAEPTAPAVPKSTPAASTPAVAAAEKKK